MISKIIISNVTSYKKQTSLETDKKVNIIYGLNGTGKSTLSNFLYDRGNSSFSKCSIEGLANEDILVYNQRFIRDYFFETDSLKGIFTLSKENKEAEQAVKNAEQEIQKFETEKKNKTDAIATEKEKLAQKKTTTENKTWEIKAKFAGGDRVLEYCLTGLMGKKETLFNHLLGIARSTQRPEKTTDLLKKEVEAIQGSTARKYELLPTIEFTASNVEGSEIFKKTIIGNENSTVAKLIKELGNSDWVKEGITYLPTKAVTEAESCPFCQEKTITSKLTENIKEFFDESYENDISELKIIQEKYDKGIDSITLKETYELNPFVIESKLEFENYYNSVSRVLEKNKTKISEKLKTPSVPINMESSVKVVEDLNKLILKINETIKSHNKKIENKEVSLDEIKDQFWEILRWDYDSVLEVYSADKADLEKGIDDLVNEIKEIDENIKTQKQTAAEQQKKTVNIDEAITNINNGLIELGIEGFKIQKHDDVRYRLVRQESGDNTFNTLSEGEKMIISFLYFRELCRGKKDAASHSNKKIIVIDDPISSLSHIYVFNVGQLIKYDFFNSTEYEQIFVLTHSLYFFYELADANHDRRKKNQALFRIIKNNQGSCISSMKYEEIQNDYQSYWYIIKDDNQPPALIANCMRNVIEYFFNFIEKKDLNNVFQKPVLQQTKYQAFCRYINRESHSLGQNIFDFKEFNYTDFKEALALVFMENGYKEHYDEMIK